MGQTLRAFILWDENFNDVSAVCCLLNQLGAASGACCAAVPCSFFILLENEVGRGCCHTQGYAELVQVFHWLSILAKPLSESKSMCQGALCSLGILGSLERCT